MSVPVATDEAARLEALQRYRVLDTPAETALDELTLLAAQICGTPIALISLVDRDRQWFKARVGLDVAETPRGCAFCAHTILESDLLVVPDAQADARFADNTLVTGAPHVRFYAGAPLLSPEGHALGALCVIDRVPRALQPEQAAALRTLSRAVMAQLDARRLMEDVGATLADLDRAESALRSSEERFRGMVQKLPTGVIIQGPSAEIEFANGMALELLGLTWEQVHGRTSFDPSWNVIHDDGSPFPGETHPVVVAIATGRPVHGVVMGVYRPRTDDRVWLLVNADPELDAEGRVRQVLCAFTDVTERRLAAQRMEQSEQRYRLLFEQSPAFICTHDLSGRLLTVNPAGARALGYEPAELQGRELARWIPAPLGERFAAYLAEVRARGLATGTMNVITREGEVRLWRYRNALQNERGADAYVIGFAQDVTELLRLSEERRQLALTDPLTGIANRRAGEQALLREAARAQRHRTPLSVALFDLDHFKSINDRFGHAAGDRALREIARLLMAAARGSDHLVRWGGEEFLAVLPGETLEGARRLAERARESVGSALLGGLPRITLSSGVAELRTTETPGEVLARADAALYAAKSDGRDLVR